MIKLAKILYPTDFSELSLTALKYAKAFARQFNAEFHCLHVVDESHLYYGAFGPDGGVPIGPDPGEMFESASREMTAFVDQHLNDVSNRVVKTVSGRPFVEIVRYARGSQIDLIVIATHGRSGLRHVLIGSVAERVVRKSPCPVLTCRSAEHEFVMP